MYYIGFQRGIKWVQQNTNKKVLKMVIASSILNFFSNGLFNIHLTHNVIFLHDNNPPYLDNIVVVRKNVTTIACPKSNLIHNTRNHKPHQGYTHKIYFWVLHAHLFILFLLKEYPLNSTNHNLLSKSRFCGHHYLLNLHASRTFQLQKMQICFPK